jgi:Flp pilus assembly protein TadG
MKNKLVLSKLLSSGGPLGLPQNSSRRNKGQATVEFTLVFIILLIIAWIPADFGLAFLSGQIASNAAREGARIGSATTSFDAAEIASETCRRLSIAFLTDPGALGGDTKCAAFSNARVLVDLVAGSGACNQMVRVRVRGNYNYFFYQLLNFIKVKTDLNSQIITRQTLMRWEHQC